MNALGQKISSLRYGDINSEFCNVATGRLKSIDKHIASYRRFFIDSNSYRLFTDFNVHLYNAINLL